MSGLTARIRCHTPILDVDVQLPSGNVLAVFGANGTGKSTLLRSLAGLQPGVTGSITIDDRVLLDGDHDEPPHRRRTVLLSQQSSLFPHMTVRKNIEFSPTAMDIDHWMDLLDVAEFADRKPHQISVGQAQRVAIARAMAARPALLMLDEPFAALDVQVISQLRPLLRRALADRSQTAMMVTHSAADARALAQSALVLDAGRVVAHGSVDDVLAATEIPFIAALAES